jgi:CHAT domain-containing protein
MWKFPIRSLGFAMLVAALSAAASAQDDPFASCRQQFAGKPDNYDAAYCFYEVAQQKNLWNDGAKILDTLISQQPDNLWLPLAYGHVYRTRDPKRAEMLYRRAADGFQHDGNAEGEILARSNLRNFLFPKGRVDEAARETERVAELGRSVSDPLLKARAWTLEATQIQDSGGDLGQAYGLLKRTEAAIFPDGPYRLKRSTLNSLGLVAFRLGRLDEALTVFQSLDTLARAEGELLAQANAQSNILNTTTLKERLLPGPDSRARIMQLAERALATAVAAQNRDVTLKTHRAIAELLMQDKAQSAKALEHVNQCLELAVKFRQPGDESVCAWVKASILRDQSLKDARRYEQQALDAARRARSPRTDAYSAGRHMRLSWDTNARPKAIADSLGAIDTMETLRSLQGDADASAEQFSTWTSDYYWLSGRLLRDSTSLDGDGVNLAFTVTERMRARSLLDTLERARPPQDAKSPAAKARRELLESISSLQRQLMDPALGDDARRASLNQQQDLELRERDARRALGAGLRSAAATAPVAGIGDIRNALRPNEALLSFQVGLWQSFDGEFGGGSWLVVLTRDGQALYRMPDRRDLTPVVPMFTGLIERADGMDEASAVRLYDLLLAAPLAALPQGIDRLIIVPDGPLHHLPFDALRAQRGGPALASRYEIIVAPSANLWRMWRDRPAENPTQRTLAFADPVLASAATRSAATRSATLERGLRLGRLPFARQESQSIQRHIGGVETLVGSRASEKALKDRDLRRYDIVHFAVHAIADEGHPDRSAVLLAPGAANEDGLLQAREIEGLDLTNRVVILSACQTATGAVLSGEGVLSLARAFFAAGATTVIGSRWPIRDDDAAALFDSFYRSLGQGATLSDALKQAKAEAITAGRPAAAWASLILLGDGEFRPYPNGRPAAPPEPFAWRLPALALALVAAVLAWGASRSRDS